MSAETPERYPEPPLREDTPMTVGELVDVLLSFDPATNVVVRGYEGGYTRPVVHAGSLVVDWAGNYEGPWHVAEDGVRSVIVDRYGR